MPPWQPTGFVENLMLSHVTVLKLWHKRNEGVKITWLLMDCSYVIAFSCQNDWTSKRHYKALDVTVNQRIILSVSIFKEFDRQVILL